MGFRVRRSINLGGGFRINVSKSGIGYSWGVPGYRITKTAKGNIRKTYSLPGTGISYVEETSGREKRKRNSSINYSYVQEPTMEDVVSADIENYRPAEYEDFVKSIERIVNINKLANWLCVSIVLSAFPIFLVTGIIGIILKIYVRTKGKMNLEYEMDKFYIEKHKKLVNAWTTLSKSSQLLQIIQTGKVHNKKIHAGASQLVNPKPFIITTKLPFYLKTDIDIIQLKLMKENLIFFSG